MSTSTPDPTGSGEQPALHLVPVSFRDACGFVTDHHRHHQPPAGCKFVVGVADTNGVLHGVLIAGRPVSRHLDDGMTLEVTRTATDGTPNANSMLYAAARNQWVKVLDEDDREMWRKLARELLADAGATPTTDPAPAAADVQWGVQRADGVLDQRDDEPDAREHLNWFDPGTAHVVSRTVVYGPWTPAPAAPQAPAEPTDEGGHRVAVKRSTTDRLFWMADCKDCPDSYGGNARKVADWAVEHTFATTPPDSPAAREDTAPPDSDGYNSDLTAGFLRAPVGACSCQPTAAAIHVPGTYCGDEQYEQAVDAMRAAVGRAGDERDEEAVSAVLGYLANPTPEEQQ